MYDVPVNTDRTIVANRPNIIIHDKSRAECFLIDVSVPNDSNISRKKAEKIRKYKDLEIEISRMWKTRTKMIPGVVGALGTVSTEFKRHLTKNQGTSFGSVSSVDSYFFKNVEQDSPVDLVERLLPVS